MFYLLPIRVLKRRFTGRITLIARRDMRQKVCSVGGRQGIIVPEGIGLHFN
jgi:hypothetical protein